MKTKTKTMLLMVCVAGLAACSGEGPAQDSGQNQAQSGAGTCSFASGRPCAADQLCFGGQDNDCNYYVCSEGAPVGSAVGCGGVQTTSVPMDPGQQVDCDPRLVAWTPGSASGPTPLPNPCPLGQLRQVTNGQLGECVANAHCKPWACDPQFGDDGCPSGMQCDGTTRMCR